QAWLIRRRRVFLTSVEFLGHQLRSSPFTARSACGGAGPARPPRDIQTPASPAARPPPAGPRPPRRRARRGTGGGACVYPPTSSARALLHRTKFLHTAPKADLRGVEGALRVNRNVVHPLELAGLAPVATKLREQFSILARQRVDLAIGAVGDEDELLLRIDRQ